MGPRTAARQRRDRGKLFDQAEAALDTEQTLPVSATERATRTIAALADEHLADGKQRGRTIRTLQGRESKINAHIVPAIPGVLVAKWRVEHSREVMAKGSKTIHSLRGREDLRGVLTAMRKLAWRLGWLDLSVDPQLAVGTTAIGEGPCNYAVSGLGHRAATTYLPRLTGSTEPVTAALVAVVDSDPARLARFAAEAGPRVPTYLATDYARMLTETRPDEVIVCGPDDTHAEQIELALQHGVAVLTEKPMVLTAADAGRIIELEQAGPARVRVAHNLRYLNAHRRIKTLLDEGTIGRPRTIHFGYRLDPGHGASYFRRWHRHRSHSGGLELTKSTHHLDLLSWWLGEVPTQVIGVTDRLFYTPQAPHEIADDADIDDTLHALITFSAGTVVSYSLVGCAPWEGYEMTVYGSEGTLDFRYQVRPADGEPPTTAHTIRVGIHHRPGFEVSLPLEDGRHGGADRHLLDDLFTGSGRGLATATEAARAVATGEALTVSSRHGAAVAIRSWPEQASSTDATAPAAVAAPPATTKGSSELP